MTRIEVDVSLELCQLRLVFTMQGAMSMTRSDVDMSLDIQRDLERQLEAAVNQLRDAQAENSRAAIKLGATSVELGELQAKYDKDLSSSAATIALCRVCFSYYNTFSLLCFDLYRYSVCSYKLYF